MKNLTQAEIIDLMNQGLKLKRICGSNLNNYVQTFSIENKKIHFKTFEKMNNDKLFKFESMQDSLAGTIKFYSLK